MTELGIDPIEILSDPGLGELRSRLDELHRRVELLGSEGVWAEPEGAPPGPPPGATELSYGPPLIGGEPSQEPDLVPIELPRYEPAANGAVPLEPGGPAPESFYAPSATVTAVDAGPFAGLSQLRRFEDELRALGAVRDVRVRRFRRGRAHIEVGMSGSYALQWEIFRLGRVMHVDDAPGGEVVIELEPLPEPDPPAAEVRGEAGERDHAEALADRLGVPLVDLDGIEPRVEAMAMIPEPLRREGRCVPLEVDDEALYLGIADSLDDDTSQAIRELTDLRIRTYVVGRSDLDELLTRCSEDRADRVLSRGQRVLMVAFFIAVVAAFALAPMTTGIALVGLCATIYIVVSLYEFQLSRGVSGAAGRRALRPSGRNGS
jgi:hypothetical protein